VRVRRALYEAIDVEAIRHRILLDNATPTAVPFWPGARGYNAALDVRLPFDPGAARRLLAEAGYPEGFEVDMDCANDRDVSTVEVCQAVAVMWAKIGVKVNVVAQLSSQFLTKVLGHKSSLYVSGWLDATFDALNPLSGLVATQSNGRGPFNAGGYSNAAMDALIDRIEVEDNEISRQQAIDEAVRLYRSDVAQIPLHHQWLAWGMKDTVELVQTPDNILRLQWVSVK
jgi:peptide/nickel transport system substrate-binding protein